MKEAEKMIEFIRLFFKKANRKNAVIGLSGGIDSSTVVALSAQALGPKAVYPVFMPYYQPFRLTKSFRNAKKLIQLTKIPLKNFIIEEISAQINAFKKQHGRISKIDLGNKMARERMSLLYYYARKLNGLVVGTSNKSESLLGYFTLHGDGAWDLAPIAHLYKAEVKELARFLKIPPAIIKARPSAGLWPGQTDEAELGFSYQTADQILKKFIEQKMSPAQIEKTGISKQIISRVLKRYRDSQFKLRPPETML